MSRAAQGRLSAAELAFLGGHRLPEVRGNEPCIGLPHVFFPDRSSGFWPREVAKAIRLCGGCDPDRRLECHVGAVRRHETEGIWGGQDFFDINNTSSARNKRRRRDAAAKREAS